MKSPVEIIRLAQRYSLYITETEANAYLAWGRLGQIIRHLPPTRAFDLAFPPSLARLIFGLYRIPYVQTEAAHV